MLRGCKVYFFPGNQCIQNSWSSSETDKFMLLIDRHAAIIYIHIYNSNIIKVWKINFMLIILLLILKTLLCFYTSWAGWNSFMFLRVYILITRSCTLRGSNCTKAIYYIVILVQCELLTEMQKDKFTHVISHQLWILWTSSYKLCSLLIPHLPLKCEKCTLWSEIWS